MIRNYLKTTLRNLWKHKAFTFINVFGLAAGLTACLLIGLYIQHELSFDQFHQNGSRIARAVMHYSIEGTANKTVMTGTKVGPAFRRDFPEVEGFVRVSDPAHSQSTVVVKQGDLLFNEPRFCWADSSFFDFFSFKLLKGNPKTVLNAPNQVVLTASTARKYFGIEEPVGKIIRLEDKVDYLVTGIAEDAPSNSQLQFDFVASFNSLSAAKTETWWNANYVTYLLLRPSTSIAALQSKIASYMRQQSAETEMTGNNFVTYLLEPLADVHLYSEAQGGMSAAGDITYVYIFLVIALLILVIAATNYMNLTTARATERAKEVGMRKVLGAFRRQLFWQFLSESLVLTLVALALSLAAAAAFLPSFNQLSQRQLSFNVLFQPIGILSLTGIWLLVSFVAGSYPALALSYFQPIKVLKGAFKNTASGLLLRKSLIVLQFIISVFLIVSTLVVNNQMNYIQNKKLGYDKQHIIALPTDGRINKNLKALKNEFTQNPNVKNVALAYETPTFIQWGDGVETVGTSNPVQKMITAFPGDEDLAKTLDIKIIAGSDLTEADIQLLNAEDDSKSDYRFLINETLAKQLGWKPQEAVAKKIKLGGRLGEIKGVFRDFHFASMKQPIGSLGIFPVTWGNVLLVKMTGNNIPQTLSFLENKWKTLAPHRPFSYTFLDEEYRQMYANENRISRVFTVFAGLAILLACLGLFGLVAYTTAQRTKEIGIRKVLGASVLGITALLSKDFLKLVLIAIVIASPIAWYAMNEWLKDFVYRMDIQWWVFGLAGVVAVGIALLTVSAQSIRAALMNPVKSLKSE
ncbi:ABC transporter permease [Runella aurantiaca]|uniref:ABC transporter permease n=1 Tax=Runella aurantiaca TaxID=2282308 RepID=A0A369IFI3_9BACT|nr:ABC transporter permease [Runella aurantiaca]RDB05406.1 ABC transporter permease [Runella aurantiaca]